MLRRAFKVNVYYPEARHTNLNNYHPATGDKTEGAWNACRLAVQGEEGETGTFTENEGALGW
jgi:hypothetical protein